jgi:hypothetical protein
MGIIESIKGGVSRAIWKGVKHAGTAVGGVVATLALKYVGLEVSVEHQLVIATFITGLLGTGLKLLKDKVPALSWL